MFAMWELLPPSFLPCSVPSLLFSFRTDGAGYTIHLTDLTYIWSESLDNEQIVERTLVEETSIEPKEDPGQLRILLEKIQQGLQGSDEGNLSLLREGNEMHLLLRVSARLPPPFRPLQWPIHLTLMAQEALKAELLVPLLANQIALKQQVASLLVHIKEKDNVIIKLTDKLASTGIDMSMIFPGAAGAKAGKRGMSRGMAAKVVQGLSDFNEDSWKKEMAEARVPNGDENGSLGSLLASELPISKSIIREPRLNAWWNDLKDRADETPNSPKFLSAENPEHFLINAQGSVQVDVRDSIGSEIDEEFERQLTPPSFKRMDSSRTSDALQSSTRDQSIPHNSVRAPSEGATIEGEENLDAPHRPSAYPKGALADDSVLGDKLYAASTSGYQTAAPQSNTLRSRTLGLVGGRTQADLAGAQGNRNQSYRNAQPRKTPELDAGSDGLETPSPEAHEVVADSHHETAPPSCVSSPSTSTKTKGRLGVIGGRMRNNGGELTHTHVKVASSPSPPYRPTSKPDKITTERATLHEVFRGLPGHDDDPLGTRDSPMGLSGNGKSLQRPATPPLENAQERADKKRAELKRLLEEKVKAPTMKKRKF
ncbi:MAG: hypothetical protein M1830_000268 [Pleopsidium flavum]|nr:MAG: hypothetical protein M1830_000268 [Pleopsidium flavum]